MDWVLFAILSTVLFTLVNFTDKYVLAQEVRDYRSLPIYTALIAGCVGLVIWTVQGFPLLSPRDTVLMLIIGALMVCASVLYFRAIDLEHTSTIIVLVQMQPVMVLVLAWLFLDERITGWQLVGFVLILAAALGVSMAQAQPGRLLSPALPWMIGVNLALSMNAVLFKFVSGEDNAFFTLVAYENFGNLLGGVLLFTFLPPMRRAFINAVSTVSRRTQSIIVLNEGGLVMGAKITTLLAISLGPVALVKVVATTQVFIGIAMGWLLTKLLETHFQEDTSRRGVLRKTAFAGMMFIGVLLISPR